MHSELIESGIGRTAVNFRMCETNLNVDDVAAETCNEYLRGIESHEH